MSSGTSAIFKYKKKVKGGKEENPGKSRKGVGKGEENLWTKEGRLRRALKGVEVREWVEIWGIDKKVVQIQIEEKTQKSK